MTQQMFIYITLDLKAILLQFINYIFLIFQATLPHHFLTFALERLTSMTFLSLSHFFAGRLYQPVCLLSCLIRRNKSLSCIMN